jgi:phage gp46-like protein
MDIQQGDVLLFQTVDGGDININNGIVEMSGGLETAAYLSLFGGNEDDDGRDDNDANWWGNLLENETSKQYRSETQFLLQAFPVNSSSILRLESANKRDLAWFVSDAVASSVDSDVTIPGVNKINMDIDIDAIGQESSFNFLENWKFET